jgi:hypothetical protein
MSIAGNPRHLGRESRPLDAPPGLYAGMIDLPIEKVADVVAALRNEVWGNPEQERRALPRIRIWAPRSIELLAPIEALDVWLVDLACGGIGFLSPRPLEVGRGFRVTLPAMDAPPVNLLCQVLHCQPAANGSFTVGGRFIEELPEASAPAAETAPAELRRAS